MKKYFVISCLLALCLWISCRNEEPVPPLSATFEYTGNNQAGRSLVAKLHEESKIAEWNLISHDAGTPLLDYTLFGYGTQYALHYAVPIRNNNSGLIDSYLVYQLATDSTGSLPLNALKSPVIFDKELLNNTPVHRRYIPSYFFLYWKEQGLPVNGELSRFAEKLYYNLVTFGSPQPATKATGLKQYWVDIDYWLDLHGYRPDGVDAYGISLETRKRVFYQNEPMLKNHLKNIKRFYREVTFDIVKFDFVAEVEITELVRGINAYVQGCSKTFKQCKGSPTLVYQFYFSDREREEGENTGSSSGGGGITGKNNPPPLSPGNFHLRIITDRFKVKVREELGLDIRTIPVSFIESDCFPTSFAQYNHKDARINVCQKIFEYNFTDVDIQAIIYHECVHAKQHQEGRYPQLDEEGNIKQYLIKFPIDDEFIEKRWNEFYEHMDFKNISRDSTKRTAEQQKIWDTHLNSEVIPWIREKEVEGYYEEEGNVQQALNEIEAYEKELEAYEKLMSPINLKIQREGLEKHKRFIKKIYNN